MPAKGKAADKGAAAKGKGKGKADEEEKGTKVKGAQQINVRHILVSCVARPMNGADI
jgi:NIMA-interacting peptidyl-prolyl cis-trans isomerase 4